jgi:hypothetical protein
MLKWLRRILVGTLVLVVLLLGAAGVVTNTAWFRGWLLQQIVVAANDALVGEVTVAGLDGSIWSELVIRDLRVTHGGEEALVVPAVRLAWTPLALLGGRVAVTAIEITDPVVRATEDADGNWGVATALSLEPPEKEAVEDVATGEKSAGLPVVVSIPAAELRGGHVVVKQAGEAARVYDVESLHLDAGVELVGVGVDATLRDLSLRVVTEGAPPVDLVVAGAYDAEDADHIAITVDRLSVTTPDSALHVAATVTDLNALVLDATVTIDKLSSAEVQAFVPDYPLVADVTATLAAKGSKADLKVAGEIKAADARIGIDGGGDISGEEPRYDVAVVLERLDPEKLLGRTDVAGVLGGTVKVAGTGTALPGITAQAKLEASGLRAGQASLGNLTLDAGLDRGEAKVIADLVHEGRAHLETTVGIEAERYDVRLDVADLDLGSIAGAKGAESKLVMGAHVVGTGFAPERANATVDVTMAPSRVGALEIDGGVVKARVAKECVHVDALRIEASDTVLEAKGEMGITADAKGHLEMALRVPDVKPWLTVAGQNGEGALTLTATADGAPTALAVDAHAETKALRVGTTKVGDATIDADLTGVGGEKTTGTVSARVTGLDAGIEVESVDATVGLEGLKPPTAQIAVDAVLAEESRRQVVRAKVVAGEDVLVDLARLSLELPTGQWELARQSRIVYGPAGVSIDGFRLASGAQYIEANGALGRGGGRGLGVRAVGLDLASFEPLAGDQVGELRGMVNADVRVEGSLDAPRPSGSLTMDGGRVEVVPIGVTIDAIELDTRFTPERIEVAALTAQAGEGRLRLAGEVGLAAYRPDDADLRLTLTDWPAADTEQYQATVEADLTVRGPLTGPDVGGRFEVKEADLRPPLSLPGSEGPAPRDQTILVVQEQEARAEAEAEAEAAAETPDVFLNTAIDLEIVLDRGVWVKHERSAIELQGDLDVRKPRGDPDVALVGKVEVVRGWLNMYGRRLTAERGIVTFTGGREIDPMLDVEVRSRIDQYDVAVLITGTGSKPKLAFESNPPLDQADVLAVLMFGKPVNQLSGGEQTAVGQQAAGIASSYAAGKLSQAFGDALGIQISELDVTKGRVGVGRYVTPKTYVSITQDQSGGGSREVQVQYYYTPKWTFETSTTTQGDSGADVFWQTQY